jgi:hypothetical protein
MKPGDTILPAQLIVLVPVPAVMKGGDLLDGVPFY